MMKEKTKRGEGEGDSERAEIPYPPISIPPK